MRKGIVTLDLSKDEVHILYSALSSFKPKYFDANETQKFFRLKGAVQALIHKPTYDGS